MSQLNENIGSTKELEESPITNEYGPCSILVKNLPRIGNLENKLNLFFSENGKIDAISIREDKTDNSLLEATVRFENNEATKKALLRNGSYFEGKIIDVKYELLDASLSQYVSEKANEIEEQLEELEHETEEKVSDISEQVSVVGKEIQEETNLVTKQALEKVEETKEQVENISQTVTERAIELGNEMKVGADELSKQASELGLELKEGVENISHKVTERAIELGNEVKVGAENISKQVSEKANELSGIIQHLPEQAEVLTKDLREGADNVLKQVNERAIELRGNAEVIYDQASEKAIEGVRTAIDKADQITTILDEEDVSKVQEQARMKLSNKMGRVIVHEEVVPQSFGELVTVITNDLKSGYGLASEKVKEIDQIISEKTVLKEAGEMIVDQAVEMEHKMEEKFAVYGDEIKISLEQVVEKANQVISENQVEEKFLSFKEDIFGEINRFDAILMEKFESFNKKYHVSENLETVLEKAKEFDQTYHIMDKVHQAEDSILELAKETYSHVQNIQNELHVRERANEAVHELNTGVEHGKQQIGEFLEQNENVKKGAEIISGIGESLGNAFDGLIHSNTAPTDEFLDEGAPSFKLIGVRDKNPEQEREAKVLLSPRI